MNALERLDWIALGGYFTVLFGVAIWVISQKIYRYGRLLLKIGCKSKYILSEIKKLSETLMNFDLL